MFSCHPAVFGRVSPGRLHAQENVQEEIGSPLMEKEGHEVSSFMKTNWRGNLCNENRLSSATSYSSNDHYPTLAGKLSLGWFIVAQDDFAEDDT